MGGIIVQQANGVFKHLNEAQYTGNYMRYRIHPRGNGTYLIWDYEAWQPVCIRDGLDAAKATCNQLNNPQQNQSSEYWRSQGAALRNLSNARQ